MSYSIKNYKIIDKHILLTHSIIFNSFLYTVIKGTKYVHSNIEHML